MLILISGHVNYPKFFFMCIIYFKGFMKTLLYLYQHALFHPFTLSNHIKPDDLKLSPVETFLPTHTFTRQGQNPSDLILTIP